MTQAELSKLSGISLSFLGHIERGTRKLSVDTLARLAGALGASFDQLIPSVGEGCSLNRPLFSRADVQAAFDSLFVLLGK